jgi:hypothetical protein
MTISPWRQDLLQDADQDSRTTSVSLLTLRDWPRATRNTEHVTLLLLLILLVALFLRVYRLAEIPAGLDYDESAYYILSQEIANGQCASWGRRFLPSG